MKYTHQNQTQHLLDQMRQIPNVDFLELNQIQNIKSKTSGKVNSQ